MRLPRISWHWYERRHQALGITVMWDLREIDFDLIFGCVSVQLPRPSPTRGGTT